MTSTSSAAGRPPARPPTTRGCCAHARQAPSAPTVDERPWAPTPSSQRPAAAAFDGRAANGGDQRAIDERARPLAGRAPRIALADLIRMRVGGQQVVGPQALVVSHPGVDARLE